MKFMKLGSKPDQFQSDGENIRFVASDLATDIIFIVGDVKFFVHKFPLLSKCSLLQKLVAESSDEIVVTGIPGGPAAFEICAKFCYSMVVTLNAYNVVAARCASEFLGMYETVEKGNLIYKIDVFLSSSIFRSWKDSIIVLQTTRSFVPWSEELKIISHSVDSIALKASTEPSKVEWSYTYNRKKLPSETGHDSHWNGVIKQHVVPNDWWVEDLCDLPTELYKEVIMAIRENGALSADVIGESLKAYTTRKLPGLSHGTVQGENVEKSRYLVDTISCLLPKEKGSVSCGFLLSLLHSSIVLDCNETARTELMRKTARQLEDATVSDLLFSSPNGEMALYNIDVLHGLVELFTDREPESRDEPKLDDASRTKVARLVDDYLAEAARDPSLTTSQFISLAETVSGFPRSSHDAIYRAIDMYLKEHPDLSKNEKRRICHLIDCRKLSAAACAHAVQNDRLPLRVVVQVLFFQQAQANGGQAPSFPGLLPRGSYGSSRSATTNSDEEWEADQASDDRKDKTGTDSRSSSGDKASRKKMKKIFSRLWTNKERTGENSGSDTSDSPASTSAEETKEMMMKVAGQIANQMEKKLQLTR